MKINKVLLIVLTLILCCNITAYSQSSLPVQTTWIFKDDYGRRYDSGIPKERYRVNASGEINGLYIRYAEDGKTIEEKSHYKNGVKHGVEEKVVLIDVLGLLIPGYGEGYRVANYVNGKKEGKVVTYFDRTKKQIQAIEYYKNDLQEGEYIVYYKNGNVKIKANFKNDKGNGLYEEYYENGQIKEKGQYKNNEKDGLWIEHYENGKMAKKVFYNNGIKDGLYEEYYENGQIKEKGQYKNNEKDGLWITYNKEGKMVEKIEYDKGVKNGIYWSKLKTDYMTGDTVLVKGFYINGEKDSIWFNYGFYNKQDSPYEEYMRNTMVFSGISTGKYYNGFTAVKKGYISEFDNGEFIKDYKALTKEDSLELERQRQEQLRLLKLKQQKINELKQNKEVVQELENGYNFHLTDEFLDNDVECVNARESGNFSVYYTGFEEDVDRFNLINHLCESCQEFKDSLINNPNDLNKHLANLKNKRRYFILSYVDNREKGNYIKISEPYPFELNIDSSEIYFQKELFDTTVSACNQLNYKLIDLLDGLDAYNKPLTKKEKKVVGSWSANYETSLGDNRKLVIHGLYKYGKDRKFEIDLQVTSSSKKGNEWVLDYTFPDFKYIGFWRLDDDNNQIHHFIHTFYAFSNEKNKISKESYNLFSYNSKVFKFKGYEIVSKDFGEGSEYLVFNENLATGYAFLWYNANPEIDEKGKKLAINGKPLKKTNRKAGRILKTTGKVVFTIVMLPFYLLLMAA
tara:strand:- start:42489 stop:44708 length:2220 start_codon:yes stop_codon:yes gene_type:complete